VAPDAIEERSSLTVLRCGHRTIYRTEEHLNKDL
jgi:hypothetical protein